MSNDDFAWLVYIAILGLSALSAPALMIRWAFSVRSFDSKTLSRFAIGVVLVLFIPGTLAGLGGYLPL